ncbi:HEAT repeat domain-containing protein [Trinickia acidisoli]|uniref:HEAT repeat domain-containing protein n=1 Tax=Trinickia acidisoli TaxID=2767482 RepID=UPI001A8C2535|nr:HEAT repeat domain-containing protein [Trinickia acidisoli]
MNTSPIVLQDLDAIADRAADALARLQSPDEAVRRIALLQLADLESAATIPAFIAALRGDEAAEIRQEAASILGAWERDDVVDALCAALLDADDDVRAAAADSLSELKQASSGAVLQRWVRQPDPFVRRSVLRGLRELRCAEAFGHALSALDDDDATVRLEAVAVLGWLKDERALGPLAQRAAGDADAGVRRAAVGALGFAPAADETTARALLAALRDDAWQVREEATATLGKLRTPSAVDPLVAALDDPYWQIQLRAVRSLGQIRNARAAPAVAALLTHPIGNLRREAALALGELRDTGTLPALRDALLDSDPDVRKAARIAIAQIGEDDR